MRFRFIATEKATFPVRMLCRTLQVSRAGFYAWQGRAPAARSTVGTACRAAPGLSTRWPGPQQAHVPTGAAEAD